MEDHVEQIVCSSEANQIILHVVTNDLVTDKTPVQICNDIINLTIFINDHRIKVAISLMLPHSDGLIETTKTVNAYLVNICESIGVKYSRCGNIRPDFHLNVSKLHLNKKDNAIFVSSFKNVFE